MAENSAVRGCMVIKPWGYAFGKKYKATWIKAIKPDGHECLLPFVYSLELFAKRGAANVAGSANACAVDTIIAWKRKRGVWYRQENSKNL